MIVRIFVIVFLFFISHFYCNAQQDTLYIKQNGTVNIPNYFNIVQATDNCKIKYLIQAPAIGYSINSDYSKIRIWLSAIDDSNNQTVVTFDAIIIDTFDVHTVKIGTQTWMGRNLQTSVMNDGTPIPHVTNDARWISIQAPAWCWYMDDSVTYHDYGKLYNYYAINSGKLCPTGWRVPTKQDWEILVKYLDPTANFVRYEASTIAGKLLKEAGTQHWVQNLPETTNESNFTALPGGCRAYAGGFSMGNAFGYYGGTPNEYSVAMRYATSSVFMRDQISLYVGVSVRCVKE